LGCCDTLKYIIPVTGDSKNNRLPSNKIELDLDPSSNSISQWLLRVQPEKNGGGKKLRHYAKTLEK